MDHLQKDYLQQEISDLFPEIVTLFHTLHQHPERGTEEFETDRIITDCLKKWGIPFRMIADTGIIAELTGNKAAVSDGNGLAMAEENGSAKSAKNGAPQSGGNSPARFSKNVVGLRADIDALPIQEIPEHTCCSSTPGLMHACGHDGHTAVLLGTARLLQIHRDEWSGTVKLFFQPAEETVGGAERMVAEGCMKNPPVDYVAGLHMMPQYHTGEIEIKYGKLNASSDNVHIDVYGKGCHGAYPENGIDAIVIASQLVLSLQTLVSRSISPLNSAVLSFGMIQGGTAGNIICDHVTLSGTLRTLDPETRTQAKNYICTQAASIAAAYGGRAEVSFHSGYDALINDNDLVDLLVKNASELIGKENIYQKEFPSLGVEDFSFFAENAKGGVFYHLGCTPPGQSEIHPLHTAAFQLDENCLKTGMLLQYTLTRKLLEYKKAE